MSQEDPSSADIETTDRQAAANAMPPKTGHRTFMHVLVNTALANVITSFLWFALTFWVYLETRSVLATGLIGGTYMLLVAFFGLFFGVLVDRYRKHAVMVGSTLFTVACFGVAGAMFMLVPEADLMSLTGIWFWLFALVILIGAVVEQLRNIALSTTVTLLVPADRRVNANGLVGTVQGLAFMITSVFSGLAIGFLGMGGAIIIALVACGAVLVHLLVLRIPEPKIVRAEGRENFADLRAGIAAVRATQGLFALILFTTFNNLTGGVFMALMDPYGLTIFPVEIWGVVLGVTATGFLIGGGLVAKFGLGKNPIRTMLILVACTGVLGATFTIREWWWLYAVGIWIFMMIIPAVEAAEQTVIQKVVPYKVQGRVFGFAMTFESAAAPITAFMIAPLAEFWIIPYMASDPGKQSWGWLLGEGNARGIAMVFLVSGIASIILGLAALATRSYRRLSIAYATAPESAPIAEGQQDVEATSDDDS
ncbi:MFS transporter [Paeniglutamicibacter sulfureus]|uniref:DHA3 family multidrug efflux protein-like MFS transporter n=1 Tax=Paeniglutamicibacter sulfureus TaxID=43666 RepID=A0ABU2BJF4_9MICC|nr:MFS transporter [Paeniglutamicibacter sulfureus]MDO2934592.1 MFS transporter [Paeniglutamicibacter sulfureus]MDR7358786.1 DHA3 family multidrug efflux protein-like MFS transporter [Paeniglutamicibacter sulfureus]